MSIVKPQKLAIISGPGSEYFTSRIVKNLRRLYYQRYLKLSRSLIQKYSMSEADVLKEIAFIDDIDAKRIPDPNESIEYSVPSLLVDVKYTKFTNGEVKAEIQEAIRGKSVYLVYDISNNTTIELSSGPAKMSINDHLMMLFTTVQALELAGARDVTLVLPTYPYARQHKKAGREALSAAMIARFFESLHVNRIITLDIHSREIENAFDTVHLENLHATYQCISQLQKLIDISDPDLTVVAPDSGAVARNKFYATTLKCPLAMLYKERDYSVVSKDANHTNIKSIRLLGDVKDKNVIIADDMISTGGTFLHAMRELKKFGAKRIICIVSLPFFDGDAIDNFDAAYKDGVFYRVIATNAVYHTKDFTDKEWFIQADVSELFARVIMRLHHGHSISPLLDNRQFLQSLINKSTEEIHSSVPFKYSKNDKDNKG